MSESVVLQQINALAASLPLGRLPELAAEFDAVDRLYFYAAGRCGLVLRMFTMRMTHLGYNCSFVGEVTTTAIQPGDLLVLGSGSGSTRSVVGMLQSARDTGARVLVLTGSPESRLARQADVSVPLPGTTKLQIERRMEQPPGSLFEQMLFCYLEELVSHLMRIHGVEPAAIMARHANLE